MKVAVVAQIENKQTGLGKAINDVITYLQQAQQISVLTCIDITHNGKFLWHLYRILTSPVDVFYMTPAGSKAGVLRDALYLIAMQLRHKPIVLHFHNSHFGRVNQSSRFLRWVNRLLYQRVTKIILLGKAQQAMFDFANLPSSRFTVVANGIDSDLFIGREAFAQKTGKRIVYFSNMLVAKGYQEVLALAHLLRNEPYEFYFSGKFYDQTLKQAFLAELAHLPRVTYIEGVYGADKATLLQKMDYFILPSRYKDETLPISMLEAMANACYIITSDVGVIREYIIPATTTLIPTTEISPSYLQQLLQRVDTQQYTYDSYQIERLKQQFDYQTLLGQILQILLDANDKEVTS